MAKRAVIRDDMGIKGGGVYAITPFDRIDDNGKMVFKIGIAIDFNGRIDSYHTYFPLGLYICALLEFPPIRKGGRFITNNAKQHIYKEIEEFVIEYIVNQRHGKRIYSTTRIRNANDEGSGASEWIYCSLEDIKVAFVKAEERYGGEIFSYKLNHINAAATRSENNLPNYVGKIIYKTG